jgi:hypothetical protein
VVELRRKRAGRRAGGLPSTLMSRRSIEDHQDYEAVAKLLFAARCNVDLGDTDGCIASG